VRDTLRLPLRIVFYKEDGAWVAHCLEFDLLGDGSTQEHALGQLLEAISLQIEATLEHNNPANLFCPADGKFFEMFAAGKNIAIEELRPAPH
jgi:predicted RNase H-like HicB family nuclease